MSTCAFCGRDESEVGRMFSGRAGVPAAHICAECAIQCAELLGERAPPAAPPPGPAVDPRILVHWTRFVIDDRALEWAAARVDIEGSPAILVSVRRPGREDSGVGVVYPDTTLPTEERARETARSFWAQLA